MIIYSAKQDQFNFLNNYFIIAFVQDTLSFGEDSLLWWT